ncbi:MAG TPA: AAA family ATPase [Thermoanaerobaculia bacterium]|nr:AAA family ATPase [Thermoanaerobaculia bacterium]
MRYLTPEYWAPFERPPKGILFEDLVEVILPSIRSGTWHRTGGSWDRARDFVLGEGPERICAECKMYHERLSLKVLSKTLVMAIVDDFSHILFFSYTPINTPTLTHLTQFQAQTGRRIEVYDDEKLESLILANEKARAFFDFTPVELRPAPARVVVLDHVSRDPEVNYLDVARTARGGPDDAAVRYLQLYETICLDIVVTNDSLDELTGKVVLHEKRFERDYRLLDSEVVASGYTIPVQLGRAGLWTKRLYFKVIRAGDAVPLPSYDVIINDAQVVSRKSNYRLKVSSLLRPPLIGKRYLEAERRFRDAVTLRERSVTFLIHGPSGSGKSRLLTELRDVAFEQGFVPFRYSGEGADTPTFDAFVRKLTAARYKLPLSIPLDEDSRTSEAPATEPLLLRVLYDRAYEPSAHEQDCVELVFSCLEGQRIIIMIDDAQALDPATTRLLNELVTRSHNTRGRFVLLMTVNTDHLAPSSPQASFVGRVKDLAQADTGVPPQYVALPITGFTKEDALAYLNHCFSDQASIQQPFSIRFAETAELFLQNVPLTPLFIEQFLLSLEDSALIERRADTLYVLNPEGLHAELYRVPKAVRDVIARRWRHARSRIGEPAVHAVRVLAFFVFVPEHQIARWNVDQLTVDALIDAAFFRIDEREHIVFHHQTFLRFFKGAVNPFDRAFLQTVLPAIDDSLRDDIAAQYYLAQEALGRVDGAMIEHGLTTIENDSARVEYLEEFSQAFVSTAPSAADLDGARMLSALSLLAGRLKARVGFEQSYRYQQQLQTRELPRLDRYAAFGREYCNLALSVAGIHVSVRNDWRSLPVLDETLERFDRLRFLNERDRAEARCSLMNRRCVALRSLARRDEAIAAGKSALEQAQEMGLSHLVMQNHIDLGYVYYGRQVDRPALVKHWSTAIREHASDTFPPSMITGANVWRYHNVHVLTLEGSLDSAAEAADDSAARAATELDAFHQVKLLLMRVVIELMRTSPLLGYDQLRATTDRVIDLCIRYNARQTYWMAYWAAARIAERENRLDEVLQNVTNALEQLVAFIGQQPEMQIRFHESLLDLALTARKVGGTLPLEYVAAIASPTIRSGMRSVLAMSDTALADLLAVHEPACTYHDGHFDLPCP